MIVKMQKVYIVAKQSERTKLLNTLYELGMVHINPVDIKSAQPDPEITEKINLIERAIQIISNIHPTEPPTEALSPEEAAKEIVEISKRSVEYRTKLTSLYHQLNQFAIWGDFRLADYQTLIDKGLNIKFFIVPRKSIEAIKAEVIEPITTLPGRQLIVAAVSTSSIEFQSPAIELTPPPKDIPEIKKEAHQIDQKLREDTHKLRQLANYKDELRSELTKLYEEAEFSRAYLSGLEADELFAIQGWIPADVAEELPEKLTSANIHCAVEFIEPEEDEEPPTLIKYPRWVKPIAGLFDILGTVPGYRELDLSAFFMIALPLFSAFLIGDAGYGLIFTLIPLLFYKKLVSKAGKEKVHLLLIIGLATFLWGVISANYFGITPNEVAKMGGFITQRGTEKLPNIDAMLSADTLPAKIGKFMIKLAPLWDKDPERIREMLIKLSFLIGCVHLTLAKLILGISLFPNLKSLAQLGWAIFLWSMLGLIWLLFFGKEELPVSVSIISYGLIVGGIFVVLFSSDDRNLIKRIGKGFASSLLPAIGTFSDTMSYIRLMAVGLATYYIASAFNGLGVMIAAKMTWLVGGPIVLFGHILNIGLAIIAIFAHGVRLNMLEFSSNAGVQWSGYPFRPFSKKLAKAG